MTGFGLLFSALWLAVDVVFFFDVFDVCFFRVDDFDVMACVTSWWLAANKQIK